MSSRSIGSLLLAALAGCEPLDDTNPPVVTVFPRWVSQQRLPCSNHLRSVRFLSANLGWVSGAATGIFRTTNGGASWTQHEHAPLSRGGDIAAMDVVVPSELHAVGSDAVAGGRWWVTADGLNWATPDVAGTGFMGFSAVDVVATNVAYYLASDGAIRHLNVSSVTTLNVGLAGTWLAIDFAGTTGVGFVAGAGGAIRKTIDNGMSWTSLTSMTLNTLRGFSFVSATIGYACGDVGTVVKTTDGTAWTPVGIGAAITLRAVHFPVDANVGWVVGNGGAIRKTVNGGTSWTPQSVPGLMRDLHDVWFVSNDTGYAVGDFGTVIKTIDGGANWSEISQGSLAQFNAVDFTADAAKGLAVGNGGSIVRTTNGGGSWAPSTSGVAVDLLGVSVPDAGSGDVAYACGATGTILRTTDFGASWTPVPSGVAVTLRGIHFPAGDTVGYCVGDGSTIRTTLTGTAWAAPAGAPPAADYHAVSAVPPGLTVYAAGTGGMVAFSTNPTILWMDRQVGVATTIRALSSPFGGNVFAAAENSNVYRSALSGLPGSWMAAGVPAAPRGMFFTTPANGWVVDGGILFSESGGTAWSPSFEHTAWVLRGIWMSGLNIGYAVGDNGTILKTATGGK